MVTAMTPLRIAALVCTLVAAAACGASPTGPGQRDGLRLTGRITDSTIAPGNTAVLTFTLENLSPRATTLTFGSSCQVMPYITSRQTGDFVYPPHGGWGCLTVMTQLELAGFGSVVKDVQIKAAATADYPYVALPPGTYLAYARLEQGPNSIQSDPVAFTVR